MDTTVCTYGTSCVDFVLTVVYWFIAFKL
jgi:hypothetical protein